MINLFCIRPKGFNVGNDAIFLGLQNFLYQAFGEAINLISLPATARYENHALAGLTARTVYEINQYGHGVILGGGNLYENGELDLNLDALESLEPPLMLFSLSRGRVYNRQKRLVRRTDTMPDRMLRALDGAARFGLFRDWATAEYLEQIGCRFHEVGGCPTIFLDRLTHRLPEVPSEPGQVALISVRQPRLMSIPLPLQSRVYGDVSRIIEVLQDAGYDRVRLLCHDHRDISFAASFPGVDFVYPGDVYSYLATLRCCAVNVTYRLHSFLPCLAFGVPTVKVSYDERATSLVETVGFGSWNINMAYEQDVPGAVADRLSRLASLPTQRDAAQPVWTTLERRMTSTFARFAETVSEYRDAAGAACVFPRLNRRAA